MASRNNDFTEKQIRGLNLTIKGVAKKYPFIKSFKFSKDFEKYKANLYIVVFIDIFEVAKYLNLEVREYYKNNLDKIESSALSAFLTEKNDENDYRSEEVFDKCYSLKREIEESMDTLYSNLPEEFKIYYVTEVLNIYHNVLCAISIDSFKQYKI